MRNIGKNIKNLRLKENLTQEELADKLFVTRQTVSNYENGKTRPDVDMIIKIGEVLNADANTVIYGLPADGDKMRDYKRAAVQTMVVVIVGIIVVLFNSWAAEYRMKTFILFPYTMVRLFINPVMFICLGWWQMDTISIVVQLKRLNGATAKRIRIGILCLIVLLFTIMIPNIVFQMISDYRAITAGSVNMSFPYIPIFSEIERFTIIISMKYPAAYTLLGIVLYVLDFPQKK